LGPLAWVLEELRKSLDAASTALRRHVREGWTTARGPQGGVDSQLLIKACAQLHQAAGALEMVDLTAPARVVRAMEAAVQTFTARPSLCDEAAVTQVERAGFAVVDYLDGLLAGKPLSAVALFPQYSAVSTLADAPRIHPADLWQVDWAWHLSDASGVQAAQDTHATMPALRSRMDQAVLRVVKSGDAVAARELSELCEALATGPQPATGAQGATVRSLWRLAAGFFEAVGVSLLPADLYVKRTASRVLVMFTQLAKGDAAVPERLGQDLAFFCAQTVPPDAMEAPRLRAVRQAWGLTRHVPVAYEIEQLGRFDPMLLAQVRKRLVAIRESWSALAGGDASRLRSTSEQFLQLRDALVRLHPPLGALADALADVAHDLTERAQPPRAELAMEVATVLLFLEAACQDFDPSDPQLASRLQRLAERLVGVRKGQAPQPLEPWVEELYRRVSHRQTMGSVVDELRVSLGELEKELDAYLREPSAPQRLQPVPGRLHQMRGVLSVLGLDHAAQAVTHMRDSVQALLQAPPGAPAPDTTTLGNNLGALGFLIDMLNYQPALARKLFVFDAHRGELRPVMGRALRPVSAPPSSFEVADVVDDVAVAADVFRALELESASPRPEVSADVPPMALPQVRELAPQSEPQSELRPEPQPQPQPQLEPAPSPPHEALPEDHIKVIGPLRIDQALFNVYLHEADEWSRQLQVEVSEWVLDPRQGLSASLVERAHALCGSSSMIGFTALADLARSLEASFLRTQSLAWGTQVHAQAYTDAAEEIRRLLHQFAAGFLPDLQPHIAQALVDLDRLEVPARAASLAPAPPPEPEPLPVSAGLDSELFVFFEEEALELLPRLGGALRQWHARPDNVSARDEVLRALHTLKGSARLAGALGLGGQAHALESLIEGLGPTVTSAEIEPALQGLDALQAAFEALRAGVQGAGVVPVLASAQEAMSHPAPEPSGSPAPRVAHDDDGSAASEPVVSAPAPVSAPVSTTDSASGLAASLVTPATPTVPAGQARVRVRAQLLDRLMNQTGEVMISRARLEVELGQMRGAMHELADNVDRLRAQLRDIELQSELQMQSRRGKDAAPDFDPLEFDRFTRVQELTRMLAESVGDVASVQRTLQRSVDASEDHLLAQARQTRELQRDLLRTRMLEFESLADRLHRVVRLAAQESGKQVTLDIQGGGIEMDRGILERMTPAFEHLLRNAVAHGIETPEARTAAGKPATGRIAVTLTQEGNDVSIRFEDDGSGLHLDRIRDKAQALGLLPPGDGLTESEAARLIFTPGFSTASTVSELAGRGIGMDVVSAEVQAVGGRIETQTRTGQGVCFDVVLPLTTAVTQVVMLRSGARMFGVPVALVEAVLSVAIPAWQQALGSGHLSHAGQALPFYRAGTLLQSATADTPPRGRSVPVVIVHSAAQRLALQVDDVVGHQEVVVKHLGPQLARLPGLAGVTVMPSGEVVLIYNPVALAAVHGERVRAQAEPADAFGLAESVSTADLPPSQASSLAPLVLVVDDSSTVRRVTQRLLQREGYRVALAGDGLQALEQLALETPALVLSDIEMPRMDGFDLVRNLRGDTRWAQLPVVMITSRIAHKHREHASALGVHHYLGKPYPEEELLDLVRRCVAPEALRPPTS
jgi:chemosensory pili system protein ChpA (sensor histidine kinase/response regulator)